MIFSWVCMCGRQRDTQDRRPPHCPLCGLVMRRNWSFAFSKPMPAHFNHAIGSYVRNRSELRSEFSRNSDEMSERMGFHVQYEPIDPGDLKNSPESFGVTGEGLDHREKTLAEKGEP